MITYILISKATYTYVNGIEYKNGVLQRFAHTEGAVVIQPDNTTYRHEFTLKDHLGNARVMYGYVDANNGTTSVADIKQVNHYYGFGLNMEGNWHGADGKNKYQFNGKELNSDFGLEWNDFGFRFYDPAIGRFPSVDPIIEKFSYLTPYNYASNSPVTNIDLWGLQGVKHQEFDENGNFKWVVEKEVRVVTVDSWDKKSNGKYPKGRVSSDYKTSDVTEVEKVLNSSYNGRDGKGVKNSEGELVSFKFNVKEYKVGKDDRTTLKDLRLKGMAEGTKGKSGFYNNDGSSIPKIAPVEYIMAGSPGIDLRGYNSAPITLIKEDLKLDYIALPHELGHDFMGQGNFKDHQLMSGTDFNLTKQVVDRILQFAIDKPK